MNPLELIESGTLVINSVLLLFLGVRHIQEIRRHRGQYEKVQLEIEALKRENTAVHQRISRPTEKEIEKFIVEPITQRLDQMTKYLPAAMERMSRENPERAVERIAQSLIEATDRLRASQTELLSRQEQIFLGMRDRIREAVADGFKDVRLELRVSSDKSGPSM
jgi:hypothetical protein